MAPQAGGNPARAFRWMALGWQQSRPAFRWMALASIRLVKANKQL
jgi:hypothetical protein